MNKNVITILKIFQTIFGICIFLVPILVIIFLFLGKTDWLLFAIIFWLISIVLTLLIRRITEPQKATKRDLLVFLVVFPIVAVLIYIAAPIFGNHEVYTIQLQHQKENGKDIFISNLSISQDKIIDQKKPLILFIDYKGIGASTKFQKYIFEITGPQISTSTIVNAGYFIRRGSSTDIKTNFYVPLNIQFLPQKGVYNLTLSPSEGDSFYPYVNSVTIHMRVSW